jgi:hypothetical protein
MMWSKLKRRIEDTFADSLRGRVEIWNTRHRKGFDEAWITFDKERVCSLGSDAFFWKAHQEAERLRGERGCADPNQPDQVRGYWSAHSEALETLEDRGDLTRWDVNTALFDYLNMSMDDILDSDRPVIRAVGMLDRRLGKRRLLAIR